MTKKVLFKYFLGYPLFLFCDKKVPWVLFENYEIHPPTPWVLLGMCSIKKVPAPVPVKVEYVHYIFFHGREGILFVSTTTVQKCCIVISACLKGLINIHT